MLPLQFPIPPFRLPLQQTFQRITAQRLNWATKPHPSTSPPFDQAPPKTTQTNNKQAFKQPNSTHGTHTHIDRRMLTGGPTGGMPFVTFVASCSVRSDARSLERSSVRSLPLGFDWPFAP